MTDTETKPCGRCDGEGGDVTGTCALCGGNGELPVAKRSETVDDLCDDDDEDSLPVGPLWAGHPAFRDPSDVEDWMAERRKRRLDSYGWS